MKKRNFGISVVIPVYNRKEKLIRAVNSIKTKNKDFVEIIIVDDCSDVSPESFLGPCNEHGIACLLYTSPSPRDS